MKKIGIDEKHFIYEDCIINDAIKKVEENGLGIVFVLSANNIVIGSISKGDLTRFIQKNKDNFGNKFVTSCMTRNVVTVSNNTPRRKIIYQFDKNVRIIPQVDESNRPVSIISADSFDFPFNRKTLAKAKAPMRISFAGGGTDLSYYFSDNLGVVISTTINKYAYAGLEKRADSKIIIKSIDYSTVEEFETINQINYNGNTSLIKAIIKLLRPEYGFNLTTHSEVYPGSGLGGSSSLATAVIGCFNKFRMDELSLHEIAELSFQAERIELAIKGGWQDQYSAVFGGLNHMEFSNKDIIVRPLRLKQSLRDELESSLILCDTGNVRNSGHIHSDQQKKFKEDKSQYNYMEQTKNLALDMENSMLRGDFKQFSYLLSQGWELKKKFSDQISNSLVDDLYNYGLKNGALSGKLLGAGGGGHLLFYVNLERKKELMNKLSEIGKKCEAVNFDEQGLRCWTVNQEM